jgi:hypothetical protein
MYNDISIAVSNGGFLTESFRPTRGIRQGCPISANIFVIVAEFLANNIRKDETIKGINIDNKQFKISQYADDTVLYLQDVDSMKNAFKILEKFTKSSGLKVNKEKSDALGIGESATTNFKHKVTGIKWPEHSIKTLGVYINNDIERMTRENFEYILKKIKNLVDTWCLRKLTIKGKIVIVNTLLITQLIYVSTVLQPPDGVIKEFKKIITDFVWNGKPPKVKYTCLINDIEEGGLKLQDLSNKIAACQTVWIRRMIDEEYTAAWKSYANSLFKEYNIEHIPLYNTNTKEFDKIPDSFYRNLMKKWADIHHFTPYNGEQVCREILWNNSFIKIDNKTVNFKTWKNQGIIFVQHLLNGNGQFSSKHELENKFTINIRQMQYNALLSAIPKEWKKLIAEDPNCNNYLVFLDCKIQINESMKKLEELKTVDIYKHLISTIKQKPTSEIRWEETAGVQLDNIEWEKIYNNPYRLTRDTRVISFSFKVTHRVLACNHMLKRWKIEPSSQCSYCSEPDDVIEHYLVACEHTRRFWDAVLNWWKVSIGTSFPINTYDIIFGITNENDDDTINSLNYLFLHGTYYVYCCKKAKKETDTYIFLLDCKKRLLLAKQIATSDPNKAEKFEKKWGMLISALG